MKKIKKGIVFGIVLLWVFGMISAYYVFHKPIQYSQIQTLAQGLFSLVICVSILSISGGLGSLIVRYDDKQPLITMALQASMGLGIIAVVMLLIGISIGYSEWVLWGMLIGPFILLPERMIGWWKLAREMMDEDRKRDGLSSILLLYVGLVFGVTFLVALTLPTKFDSLVYHISLPKIYLQENQFQFVPWLMYWGMPQVTEMLFTWAMGLGSLQTPLMMGWLVGLLASIAVFRIVQINVSKTAGYVSLASLLAGYTTAQSLSWGYVNWMNMLFGTAFLVCMWQWYKAQVDTYQGQNNKGILGENGRYFLTLGGVFVGFSLGVKYTSGVLVLIGIIIILFGSKKIGRKRGWSNLFLFLGAAFLTFSPWLMKNVLATNNPLYPFIFPAGSMDRIRLNFYQNQPTYDAWWKVFLLAVSSTILGKEGAAGFGASIGPLLFPLGFVGAVLGKKEKMQSKELYKTALLIIIPGLIIWGIAGFFSGFLIQTRLYYALFPSVAVLAGMGFKGMKDLRIKKIRLQSVVAAMILLVIGLNSFQMLKINLEKLVFSNVVGLVEDEEYLSVNTGWYAPAMEELQELPKGSYVLLLWEPRGLYCIPRCNPDEILDRWIHDYLRYSTTQTIIKSWKEEGYTHILYNSQGAKFIKGTDFRYEADAWAELDVLLGSLPEPRDLGGGYTLYEMGK